MYEISDKQIRSDFEWNSVRWATKNRIISQECDENSRIYHSETASRNKNIHIFLSAVLSLNTFDIGIMGCEKQSHGAVEFKAEANT